MTGGVEPAAKVVKAGTIVAVGMPEVISDNAGIPGAAVTVGITAGPRTAMLRRARYSAWRLLLLCWWSPCATADETQRAAAAIAESLTLTMAVS